MQPMLKTDPYLVKDASDAGRLFLVRTVGPLSGGTPVTTHNVPDSPDASLTVAGWIQVPSQYKGMVVVQWKRQLVEVMVNLEDLVVRKQNNHPDSPLTNRRARRTVLNKLKAKANK